MARNPYVDWFQNTAEQDLIESLYTEAIRFYAHDVYYLPRTLVNVSTEFNEPESYHFNQALPIEIYFKSFDAFEGDGKLLQKFGLEIHDQLILTMAIRSFNESIVPNVDFSRPREGDLIYIPMLKSVFQIMYVSNEQPFYQLGRAMAFDLTCELFEYNNEAFNTGIPEIDNKYNSYSTDMNAIDILTTENLQILETEGGQPLNLETFDNDPFDLFADNEEIETLGDDIIDWDQTDPFSELKDF